MPFLMSQCQLLMAEHGNVLLTLFLAGLVGGLTHCAGMCGPFVAVQMHKRDMGTGLARVQGAALLPYHLGRMTTYVMLGMGAALLSKQIMGSPVQQWISVLLLTVAGLMFIGSALPQVKHWLMRYRGNVAPAYMAWMHRLIAPLSGKSDKSSHYMLGVMLGFLPCGLVFAALMVVSTTASPLMAGLAMMLFTLGTFPSLFLVGLGSQLAYRLWPQPMQWAARSVMVMNGVGLFVLAGTMVATY